MLQVVTDDDVSNEALQYLSARSVSVGAAAALAQRVSYVGELGWELYVEPAWAVQVWDRLCDAGRAFGIEPCGYRALDGLRIEKGYRYFGVDLTANDDPFEAGLGFCVALDKEDFVGRDALVSRRADGPARHLRTLEVGGEDYLTIYGGEAVLAGGEVVGRLRSCAYGHTVRRNLAYSYLPGDVGTGAVLEIEVFGERVPGIVTEDVCYDPDRKRILA